MRKAGAAALVAVAVAAIGAAIAWAAAGDNVVHACVSDGSRIVRIPAAGDGCRKDESGLDWNVQGPKGDPGPQGPAGPAGASGGGVSEPNARVVGFLHVDTASGTIDGDATEKGHPNWITVVGFDSDWSQQASAGGGGAGAGKVQLKPLVITKPIDKATPKLFETLVTGRKLNDVQLDLVRSDGAGGDEVFYSVKLSNAFVTDEHQLDEGKSDGRALEQVSFTYEKIEISESGGTAAAG